MEFINMTIGEWMDKQAREYPDQPAVIYTHDFKYTRTYKEFNDEAHKIAKAFLAMGIKRGDHVAIWATNNPEWYLTLFACVKIGAVLVTVNTGYKIHEAEYLLKQSDTKMLVMCDSFKGTSYVDIMNRLCPEILKEGADRGNICSKRLPVLKKIVSIDEEHHTGMYHWSELYDMGKDITDEEYAAAREGISPHDVANMQYTSGTTGFPKGVMLTHYNILNNGKFIGDCMKFTDKDRLLVTVPLYHCFGLVLATMASITHATTMVPIKVYSPIKVMEALQEAKCTAMHGVPTMFIAILGHPRFSEFKFYLRTGIMAGSPCPIKVMQQVIDDMGMKEITIVYGQTEASPGCTQTTTDDSVERRVNTVGRAFPGVETKIVDPETGETLGPGQVGEFCARGYNIMKGYYKMPEATAQAIDQDGWLHTGDLAMVDEAGYYKITGRIKDMIIRGGENIYPKEIEDFIYTHEKVSDVQVVGVPSKDYGEEIMAFVIPKEGVTVTEDEIKDYVRGSMAKYKVPSFVSFIDEFPMNGAGKILKYKLREMAIEEKNLKDAAAIETA